MTLTTVTVEFEFSGLSNKGSAFSNFILMFDLSNYRKRIDFSVTIEQHIYRTSTAMKFEK